MQFIKSTYKDLNGNIWEIKRESLPKKKGHYIFWTAECTENNISFRSKLKRDVIKEIKMKKRETIVLTTSQVTK